MRSAEGVVMAGFGHFLPGTCVGNAAIEADLGLAPGWILRRTGIAARHYAAPGQAVSDLAVPAGAMALAAAPGAEVGLVLLATSTPDHVLPPTAPLVAHRLGLSCGALDLAGACTGFLQALALGAGQVRMTGQSVLVIAANILSRRIDPASAGTRAVFADAAGAVLLCPGPRGAGPRALRLASDGAGHDLIRVPRGGSRLPFAPGAAEGLSMEMPDGRAVFARAVEAMTGAAREVLAQADVAPAALGAWLPHQANGRIIAAVAERLGLGEGAEAGGGGGPERLGTLARHGNSSAATMPLALSWRRAAGPLPAGPLLMTAFGAGLLWGAMLWDQDWL